MNLIRKLDSYLLSRPKKIHLCWLFEKLGLPIPRYFVGWTDTGGGDHGGSDWEPADALEVAGVHTNIGAFNVLTGRTITVKPWDGASYGSFEVQATSITVTGTINADKAGFGGGGAGGGGGGSWGSSASGGALGAGTKGGSNGNAGSANDTGSKVGGAGGAGGAGGGTHGGSAGAAGSGGVDNNDPGDAGGAGGIGGYATAEGQGDSSVDESLLKGSGGGGAGGGGGGGRVSTVAGQAGGGGGGGAANHGGGYVKLISSGALALAAAGIIYARGGDNSTENGVNGISSNGAAPAGGKGGDAADAGSSNGGTGGTGDADASNGGNGGEGGYGAGGGVLLKCGNTEATLMNLDGTIDNRGGNSSDTNGGTIKLFYPEGSDITYTHNEGRHYASEFANTIPIAPTNPTGSLNANLTQIDLTWTDNSSIEDGYRIYRKVDGGAYGELKTVAANSESTSDDTIEDNHTYKYKIVAYNGSAESGLIETGDIKSGISKERNIVYDVFSWIGKTRNIVYDLVACLSKTRDILYDLVGAPSFAYCLKIYNTSGSKVAEISGNTQNPTLTTLEFELLQQGGCGAFSFTLAEPHSATIDYDYRVEVYLFSPQYLYFTGKILRKPVEGTEKEQLYSGFGYFNELEKKIINTEISPGSDIAVAVTSLLDAYITPYTSILKDSNLIETVGHDLVATIDVNDEYAKWVFDRLAEIATGYKFGINANRKFYFQAIDTTIRHYWHVGKHLNEFLPEEDPSKIVKKVIAACDPQLFTDGYELKVTSEAGDYAGLYDKRFSVPQIINPFSATNLASGITPSTNPAGSGAANLCDGDSSTLWASGTNQASGHYIEVDLTEDKANIAKIVLDSIHANAQEFVAQSVKIEIKPDGGNYSTILTSDQALDWKSTITFRPTTGRYVKISLTGVGSVEWKVGEIEIYALDLTDIQRWTDGKLAKLENVRKKATATINSVDQMIMDSGSLAPIRPLGKARIFDKTGTKIEDYQMIACKYSLSSKGRLNLDLELGHEKRDIADPLIDLERRIREAELTGVRRAKNLSLAKAFQLGVIKSTFIGPDSIQTPHLYGQKISLHSGKVELGEGVMSGGGHGFIVKDTGGIYRAELGKLNSDYGATFRDVDGNITIQLGIILRAIDWTEVSISWGVNDVSRNSVDWADLADMSITFTTKKGTILVWMDNFVDCAAFAPDPYATCYTRWMLDDNAQGTMLHSTDILNAAHMLTASGPLNVDAGEHTVHLEWKCGSVNQTWWSRARVVQAAWWNRP